MKPLNRQQKKVYDYILANAGSTAREITNATFVDARARMSEMRSLGYVFKEVGEKKFGNNKPFKMYAIEDVQMKMDWNLPVTTQNV